MENKKDLIEKTLGKTFDIFYNECEKENKSSGDFSTSASSGYNSTSASSGNFSTSASSGDYSKSASSGDFSTSASSGKHSSATANGFLATVKGSLGNVLGAIEFNSDRQPIAFAGGIVGKDAIKEDTEYVAYQNRLHEVDRTDGIFTIIIKKKGNVIHGLNLNFEQVVMVTNGILSAHGKTLKEAKESLKQKIESSKYYLEALKEFKELNDGDVKENRYWYKLHHKLTGSCKYGRDMFCKENDIDLDKSMSKSDFYNLVKDSYNGNKILK